jgi:hypothetical protein
MCALMSRISTVCAAKDIVDINNAKIGVYMASVFNLILLNLNLFVEEFRVI